MDSNSQGIYDLITKLCEKHASSCQSHASYSGGFNLRKVRSKCYEIMLLKKTSEKSVLEDLENNIDPYCHLLAWEFQLRTEHNLPQHAGSLRNCCEKLQALDAFNNASLSNILLFLLELRKVPEEEKTIIETTLDKRGTSYFAPNQSSFAFFDDSKFQLPDTSQTKSTFEEERFRLHTSRHHKVDMESVPDVFVQEDQKQVGHIKAKVKDEGYESPSKVDLDNIWEIASRAVPTEHHTWESYGTTSLKEPPFLCESGSEATNLWLNLSSSVDDLVVENNSVKSKTVITYPQFIKDMKYLLVGMESRTFRCDEKGELFLFPGRCVEGLSTAAIESYCNDFLCAGNCYKGLSTLCTINPSTQSYVHNGYIFMELCQGIKRYLSFYRVAALSISDSTPLLAFHEHTMQLRTHVTVLASVCKVGPFSESAQIPHGVALLNYLYQKVMTTANKDVIMVLYSILYPCCQVYFTRFLQQWMLEGSLQDPYNEFFIKSNSKYFSSRGRTYWTKSFSVVEDIVPDFLVDLKNDILLCGKSINLLRLCVPNSPLCLYMMDKQPNIISCCVLAEQLSKLELNNHYYYLEATALSGPRISFSQIITSLHEEDNMLLSLIAKKRVATLNRIELERKKEIQDHVAKKRKNMKILQEKYVEAQSLRKMHLIQQIEDELKTLEQEIRLQTLHNQVIEEERHNLIEYYNKLFKAAEGRKRLYDQKIEKLRSAHLESKDNSQRTQKTDHQLYQASEGASDLERLTLSSSSSTETFVTLGDEVGDKSDGFISADTEESEFLGVASTHTVTAEPLDELNGNSKVRQRDRSPVKKSVKDQNTINYLAAVGNFSEAKRNKEKVMGSRSNINLESKLELSNENLTEAQRNKMKVMASEYGNIIPAATYTKGGKRPKTAPPSKHKMNEEVADKKGTEESSLTTAQRNKLKIVSLEFGSYESTTKEHDIDNEKPNVIYKHNSKKRHRNAEHVRIIEPDEKTTDNQQPELTEAQRNKLKVMAAEFGHDDYKSYAKQTEKNQNNNLEIYTTSCDNENYINRNTDNALDRNANFSWVAKKQDSLSLDFTKLLAKEDTYNSKRHVKDTPDSHTKSPKFELDRISPMSVDSTPLSSVTTPSRFMVGFDNTQSYTNTATATASAGLNNQGFTFEINNTENRQNLEHRKTVYNLGAAIGNVPLSKNITVKDATLVSPNCLKLCLQQSLTVPLITQLKLVNNELLKYFINDLEYLNQVNILRNYFFLLDGEFGRNITEQLFAKLYDANFPVDLINHHTLQGIMFKALDCSTKASQRPTSLSFKINSLPAVFNLGDPDVFDCISLTFKPQWPLNILLPTETIAKYDEIFKFLLKLQRVAWVLQNLFQNLKSLMKEAEFGKSSLLTSPHYRRLHQCRHVMTHFIQTLQGYVIGEVVQSSWEAFEKNLETVVCFDQLYSFHTLYIKNILFMCLLNQKSAPLRKVLQKIFTVIFKFYDYVRSRDWIVENGVYLHPNFKKLEDIFANFEELTQYLFKVGHKVVQSGYQPHLLQLLDMLDINNYYTKNSDISLNV